MSDNSIHLSYEFFPPKTQKGVENLKNTRQVLAAYQPEFYSVTFGAGGSTQETTMNSIKDIQNQSDIPAAPHISCIGSSKQSILDLLNQYVDLGVSNLVALRGDLLEDMDVAGEFQYASDLVEFIRQETGDHFNIAVAAYPEVHPESANGVSDIDYFKAKMDAGANLAITQYFFNSDGFLRFRDQCASQGIEQEIVPGIMPIANFANLCRFSDNCGAEIPRWIRQQMNAFEANSESQKLLGHEVVLQLILRLKSEGCSNFHFYTMNQHALVTNLIDDAQLI